MEVHPAALPDDRLLAQCSVRRLRRSGPGGQHRNKVETAIVLTHHPSGICGQASERRSQAENRRRAIQRLRVNLALEVRRPHPQTSQLWQSRCRGRRLSISIAHPDFPALLAEALDAVDEADGLLSEAARRLEISSSQLVKLLALEPRGLQRINQQRRQRGLPALR